MGGGILIVPGLVLLLRMDQRRAHGTSLAAIVPIAASGIGGFALEGSVDWPAAALLGVGAAAGAVAGTALLRRAAPRVLRLAFAGLILVTAVRLLLEAPEATGRGALGVWMVLGLLAVGLFAGVVAGLFGVGGGVVVVPALVLLFAIPDPVAKGTSLVMILPTAVVGTLRNARHRNVDLRAAALVGLAGVVSALLGSRLALRLDEHVSAVLFGILLLVVAAGLVARERRASNPPAAPSL